MGPQTLIVQCTYPKCEGTAGCNGACAASDRAAVLNIRSPFNACMHQTHCQALEADAKRYQMLLQLPRKQMADLLRLGLSNEEINQRLDATMHLYAECVDAPGSGT